MIIMKSDLRNNLLFGGNRRGEEVGSVACSGPASSPVLCPWSSSTPSDKASMSIIGWGKPMYSRRYAAVRRMGVSTRGGCAGTGSTRETRLPLRWALIYTVPLELPVQCSHVYPEHLSCFNLGLG